MSNFRKLRAWESAHRLAIVSHKLAAGMRGAETSVLRDQLVRAAMSVPTNIVEGCAHQSPREFARYLRYALASASEVEGHAQLARDLNYVSEPNFNELLTLVVDVRMMLHGLLKKLEKD